jgi:tetratricopeptide (TPR) repeat protein
MSMRFNRFNLFQNLRPPDPTGYSSQQDRQTGIIGVQGQAIVEQAIQPNKPGRVKFRASWWSARCLENITIPIGEWVDIVGAQGITLLVEPTLLLKASLAGLTQIQQAWQRKGWTLQASGHAAASYAELDDDSDDWNIADDPNLVMETWQRFLQRKPLYVKTFKACCGLLGLDWQTVLEESAAESLAIPIPELVIEPAPPPAPQTKAQIKAQTKADQNQEQDQPQPPTFSEALAAPVAKFVGRDQTIAELHQLAQRGAKLITILGPGGMGKTTVARHYLSQQGFDIVLECWMAKETHNIVPAETVVQEWLQRHLGEQPGQRFSVSLERLRQRLCQSTVRGRPVKIGVLIDNLEPALNREGRLIETRRHYAALLEVLADSRVQSLTLVTSREPLHELNITVQSYRLPSLDLAAWTSFFSHAQIPSSPELEPMHRAYNGKAKAMTILSSVIKIDYEGAIAPYWRDHQADLLGETSLEGLTTSHFQRLQQLYPEAYRLLCRMGCYRYQNVATVPTAGLTAMLWDVPGERHQRVIRFLQELFLVEASDTGYWLHPTIQVKAVEQLQASGEWQIANQRAAAFWTGDSTSIETIAEALNALEAYYHYVQIQDWEAAAEVILQPRDGRWITKEPLGVSFYRLGLLQPMIVAITQIIQQIQPGAVLCYLHRILGDLYWLTGSLHAAIDSHEQARKLAMAYKLPGLELVSIFNLGLCQLDLWHHKEAFHLFNIVNQRAAQTDHHLYAVGSWFCLALLYSYEDSPESRAYAEQLMQDVAQAFEQLNPSSWGRCYSLLFLGLTAKNLGDYDNAQRLYELARFFAERSRYPQVTARAQAGLAELCRQNQDFQGAITHLLAAKQVLEKLDARADLAEVYYQLGLTYYRQDKTSLNKTSLNKTSLSEPSLGETSLDQVSLEQANLEQANLEQVNLEQTSPSRSCFQMAIQLYQQMNAPRQVERIQQALRHLS